MHLRPIKIDESVDVDFLAKQTPGFSGADIANVCNEAALIAARKSKEFVDRQDFLDAVDRIVGGLEKKNKIMTLSEKRSIACHEAGHATISWKLEHANPLVKVTIVPRGEALGAAWYLPEERQLTNEEHLLDEMCSTLGGRAAEELFLHQVSTGALNDLERVTKRAYGMVAYFGMSAKLPNMSYYDSTGQSDYGFTKPYSEKDRRTHRHRGQEDCGRAIRTRQENIGRKRRRPQPPGRAADGTGSHLRRRPRKDIRPAPVDLAQRRTDGDERGKQEAAEVNGRPPGQRFKNRNAS